MTSSPVWPTIPRSSRRSRRQTVSPPSLWASSADKIRTSNRWKWPRPSSRKPSIRSAWRRRFQRRKPDWCRTGTSSTPSRWPSRPETRSSWRPTPFRFGLMYLSFQRPNSQSDAKVIYNSFPAFPQLVYELFRNSYKLGMNLNYCPINFVQFSLTTCA